MAEPVLWGQLPRVQGARGGQWCGARRMNVLVEGGLVDLASCEWLGEHSRRDIPRCSASSGLDSCADCTQPRCHAASVPDNKGGGIAHTMTTCAGWLALVLLQAALVAGQITVGIPSDGVPIFTDELREPKYFVGVLPEGGWRLACLLPAPAGV